MDSSLYLPLLIVLLVVILFIFVAINGKKIDEKKKKRILEKLQALKEQIYSEELSLRRDGIIKLDNLLSKSLQLYFKNDLQCGENLKQAKRIFKKRLHERVWEAHKIRNKIVHDDYPISLEESKSVFEIYKMSIIKTLS